MVAAPDRRPSAQEIEELIDRVRRDPSSNAFVDLGEAYLVLGRPRDTIGVCGVGLGVSQNNHEGRVVLARAYAALHQWREAQGELLRVVKGDRNSRRGFALLGEVLLRRNDFERAVPVLQHAQILDPTSPMILALLKRARTGQPLDPPPPIPEPLAPRGETNYQLPPMQAMPQHPAQPQMAPRSKPPTMAPPPQMPPTERPRVIPQAKVVNAAAASLRQSAAVGEGYLADLLGGGLLDVAGVRVPDVEFDLRPDRRWGRSTRRAFVFLFVVVVLGSAGGGTWWWWSKKQQAEQLVQLLKKDLKNAEPEWLDNNVKKFDEASKSSAEPVAFAYLAESAALEALLYGTPPGIAKDALAKAGSELVPGEPGSRELVIAKAALALATLSADGKAAQVTLGDTAKLLDDYIAKDPDPWARWLKGRAQLAGGERKAAKSTFKQVADDGLVVAMIDEADLLAIDGNVDGAMKLYDKALAKSAPDKDAVEKTPPHPLALTGKALALAEAELDPNNVISEYSVALADKPDKKAPPRVASYRALALAIAEQAIEDYPKATELLALALDKKQLTDKDLCTAGVAEPRFWAGIAWTAYVRGDIVGAKAARACAVYYRAKPEEDPSLAVVDAAIALSEDHPDKAVSLAHGDDARARMIRVTALLEQGKATAAMGEADELVKLTTPKGADPGEGFRGALIVQAEAFLVTETDHDKAAGKLEGLARQAQSKVARHALGTAWSLVGNLAMAEQGFEGALKEISPNEPNPIAYRTRVALANVELTIAAGEGPKQADDIKDKLDKADKLLDDAQKDLVAARGKDAVYAPIAAVRAKLVLRRGDPDKAADLLAAIKDPTPDVQLAYAEALATRKTPDRDKAAAIVRDIKDKVVPALEVGRVARLIDAKLPADLGVPVAPDAPGPPGVPLAPPPSEHHHHHG